MKSYKTYSDRAYLAKEDFPTPEVLTIQEVREERVKAQGKPEKSKVVLYFKGLDRGLINNLTNGQVLHGMSGSDDPERWVGQTVEVFVDPNVMFGGERKGGIRLRPVTNSQSIEEPTGEEIEIPY
jgi:hypothetical protein